MAEMGLTLNSLRRFRPGERRPNADGTYSTELLRSVPAFGGGVLNMPSLYMGPNGPVEVTPQFNDDDMSAIARALEHSGMEFPRFDSFDDAELAARKRSRAGGVK